MRTGRGFLRKWVAPGLAAVTFGVGPLAPVPGTAAAAGDGGAQVTGAVAEAMRMDQTFVQLFNERKFDELVAVYYVENAIVVAPNHEPIRGRAAIADYFRGVRDAFGDIEVSAEPWRASASGSLVSVVGKYAGQAGHIRATSHELFERQSDGSLKCTVDMFGFRDPLA